MVDTSLPSKKRKLEDVSLAECTEEVQALLAQLKKEIKDLQNKNHELEEKCDKTDSYYQEALANIDKAWEENERLDDKIDRKRDKISTLRGDVWRLEEEVENLQQRIEELEEENKLCEEENKEYVEHNEELKAKNAGLEKRIVDFESKIEKNECPKAKETSA